MQLKKNPRDGRPGFPNGPIPTGFDETEADLLATSPQTPQEPRPAMPEPEMTVTRQREPQAQPQRSESVIDASSSFDGKFETADDLRIEGHIAGEVVCQGRLTIEREATAKAKLHAHEGVVRGRLEGDIVCSGRLQLASTASIQGTVRAGTLVVEEGAQISGTVAIGDGAAAPKANPAPFPRRNEAAAAAGTAANGEAGSGTQRRTRDVPSFSLVPAEERLTQN